MSVLCGLGLGSLVIGTAQEAAAISCITPPWYPAVPPVVPSVSDVELPMAIDVQPWTVGDGDVDSATCELVARYEVINATTQQARMHESGVWERFIRIVPERELSPGTHYRILCEPETGVFDGSIEIDTRDDGQPSPVPLSITSARAVWESGSDACCGYGDAIQISGELDLEIEDFYAMGGLVEVRSEDDFVWIDRIVGSSFGFWTPPMEGSLTITIVGPDGTRGEPVVVTEEEIEGKPSVGCAIATRPLPFGLALALGWAWLGRRSRRRR